jgi:DNA-binding transcriptional LysR family regulator
MELRDLRTFVAVAELASFSRAAEQLHLAQPAVSQHVKRLERDLGATVLERSTRRVELTSAGEQLLLRARAILADVVRAEDEVRLLESGSAGRVAVGFVGTATYDLLPRVSRRVRAELPGIELELHGEQLTPALVGGLLERRLDVAVGRDPEPHPSLVSRSLRTERLVAALPSDHPGARRRSVRLASLRNAAFVTHPSGHRSVMYAAVVAACRSAGFTPREVVEVRETATLVAFVAAGLGVALVPEPVRSLALEGVEYRRLSDVDQRTELTLLTRREDPSPAVRAVANLVLGE